MREIEKSNGNMRQSLKVPRNGFNELRDDIKLNPDFAQGGRNKRMQSMKIGGAHHKLDDEPFGELEDVFAFDNQNAQRATSLKAQNAYNIEAQQDNELIDFDQIKLEQKSEDINLLQEANHDN